MSPINDRGSHHRCSTKKAVLKNFAMFIGKQLCWSLFLIIKRDSNTGVLQRHFNTGECCEFLKNIYKRLLRNRFLKGHLTSYTNTTLTNQLVSSKQIVHIRIRTIKTITSYIMYIIIYNLVLFPRKF